MSAFWSEFETGLAAVGRLTLLSDGRLLTGCLFERDPRAAKVAEAAKAPGAPAGAERRDDLPVFVAVREWLVRYFAGARPDSRQMAPLLAPAPTPFAARVRTAMLDIPYGATATYGDIARRIAAETGHRPCAQAVGQACGRNPVCIIVPCHRVVGAGGALTGFGGGLPAKAALLAHERG